MVGNRAHMMVFFTYFADSTPVLIIHWLFRNPQFQQMSG